MPDLGASLYDLFTFRRFYSATDDDIRRYDSILISVVLCNFPDRHPALLYSRLAKRSAVLILTGGSANDTRISTSRTSAGEAKVSCPAMGYRLLRTAVAWRDSRRGRLCFLSLADR